MKYLPRRKGLLASMAIVLMLSFVLGIFANTMKVSADEYEYYIQVNKATNVVTVFKADGTPYVAFTASCGSATPTGTFYTENKYRWWELMGPSYGQYCTRITKSILFHSVWYYKKEANTQSYTQYNKLGTTASHGCVRLTTAASKWIYDNCPLKTKVIIFNGTEEDDVLGKPETVKIDTATKGYRGWDPTDPDPENPWSYGSAKPEIKVEKKIIQCGDDFSRQYLKVVDSCGFDITDSKLVTIKGSVNTKKLGTYKISVSVVDSCGRTASKDIVYTVVDKKKYTILLNSDEIYKKINTKRDLRKGMICYSTDGTIVTGKVQIYIKKPSSKEFVKVNNVQIPNYLLNEAGTYKVKYSVTNPNNNLTKNKVQRIQVEDNRKPSISSDNGWADMYVTNNYVYWYQLMDGVIAKAGGTEEDLTDDVYIDIYKDGEYYSYLYKGLKVNLEDGVYRLKYISEKNDNTISAKRKLIVGGGQ